MRRTRTRTPGLILVSCALLITLAPRGVLALCFGPHGHVAIEANAGECESRSGHQGPADSPLASGGCVSDGCDPCTDIPIGSDGFSVRPAPDSPQPMLPAAPATPIPTAMPDARSSHLSHSRGALLPPSFLPSETTVLRR